MRSECIRINYIFSLNKAKILIFKHSDLSYKNSHDCASNQSNIIIKIRHFDLIMAIKCLRMLCM